MTYVATLGLFNLFYSLSRGVTSQVCGAGNSTVYPAPIDRVSSTEDGTASLEPGHGKKGDNTWNKKNSQLRQWEFESRLCRWGLLKQIILWFFLLICRSLIKFFNQNIMKLYVLIVWFLFLINNFLLLLHPILVYDHQVQIFVLWVTYFHYWNLHFHI